jgi:predicted Zn-dependent peptidase
MWPDHPLGWNIAGTAETVGAISRDDLADYQKKYYQPQNMVVVFAGNAGHKDCLDFVRKALDGPAAKAQDYSFQKFISRQEKPELISLTKDIEQTKLAIGFPAYDKNNPKRYALGLIAIILGGNMSSRLFNEIREKKGLAYEISSQYKQLNDTGAFYILAGLDNKKIEMALELTLKELSKLKNNLVPEPELSRAKEYSLSHLAMSLEDTMEHMVFLGVEAATSGRLIDYQEIKKEISRVKPKDIKEVAREIFHKGKINISLVGPVKDFNKDKCFSDIDAILD